MRERVSFLCTLSCEVPMHPSLLDGQLTTDDTTPLQTRPRAGAEEPRLAVVRGKSACQATADPRPTDRSRAQVSVGSRMEPQPNFGPSRRCFRRFWEPRWAWRPPRARPGPRAIIHNSFATESHPIAATSLSVASPAAPRPDPRSRARPVEAVPTGVTSTVPRPRAV